MINPLARLVFWLIVIACSLAFCTKVQAQTIGQMASGTFVSCDSKKEALKALAILKDEGRQVFEEKFKTLGCAIGIGSGVVVGIVAFVRIGDQTYKVVEMDFGDETRYWMTTQDIKGGKEI